MWLKCSLSFFCLSSLSLLYGKFLIIFVAFPIQEPQISCRPFQPELSSPFFKVPNKHCLAGGPAKSIPTQALHSVTNLTECQAFGKQNWRSVKPSFEQAVPQYRSDSCAGAMAQQLTVSLQALLIFLLFAPIVQVKKKLERRSNDIC